MPRRKNKIITSPRFVIAAYKGDRRIGYLFWQKKKGLPKTLKVSSPNTSNIACFSTYESAELAISGGIEEKLMNVKDKFVSSGYDLEIVLLG